MHPIIPVKKKITVTGVVLGLNVIRPKGFNYAGEAHDFWEAVYVCDGKIGVAGDEHIYHLDEGMVVFHKPMEFHRLWTEGGMAAHLMIISFRVEGPGVSQLQERCFRLSETEREQYAEITVGINRGEKLLYANTAAELEEQCRILSLTATKLELLLQELVGHEEGRNVQLTADEERYLRIVKTMKENCDKALSVEALAQICDMSVSNMKRVFSLFSDIGVAKYFLTLKMCLAMELLDEGKFASHVALELGYSEPSYFYTVFKRETGMTPKQYQKADDVVKALLTNRQNVVDIFA